MHQAVLRQQANARQGTHETRTRAHVSGGGRKPWRQKGTGRARQGSNRSPQWRHGGVVFGPHPRSYEQDMPRKARRLAMRSVLSAKAQAGQIIIVDNFSSLEPRTKAMLEALGKLNVANNSALILTTEPEDNLLKASGNIGTVHTMSAHLLSIVDILKHTYLIIPRASLDVIHNHLGTTGGWRKLPLRTSTVERSEDGTVVATAPAVEKPTRRKAATATKATAEKPAKHAKAAKPAKAAASEAATAAPETPVAPAASAAVTPDEVEAAPKP